MPLAPAPSAGDSLAYPLFIKSISYKETDKSYEKKPSRLNLYKWYCVIYGSVEMIVDGAEVIIGPEESLLIPPNAQRCTRALKSMVGYICCYFENQALELAHLERQVMPLPESLLEDLRDLTRELKTPAASCSLHYIYALIIRFLVQQLRIAQEGQQDGSSRIHDSVLNHEYKKELVQKIDHFIFSHVSEPLNREQLASSFHLSPSHLSRLYKGASGHTLVDQITTARMEKARLLLLGSSMSITHIAAEVGYNSYSHFTQVFRRETGVTPSIYRKTHGNVYSLAQAQEGQTQSILLQ